MSEPLNGIDPSQMASNEVLATQANGSSSGDNFAIPKPPKQQKPKKYDNGSQSDGSARGSGRGRKPINKDATKKRELDETTDSELDSVRDDETEDEVMDFKKAISREAFNRLITPKSLMSVTPNGARIK